MLNTMRTCTFSVYNILCTRQILVIFTCLDDSNSHSDERLEASTKSYSKCCMNDNALNKKNYFQWITSSSYTMKDLYRRQWERRRKMVSCAFSPQNIFTTHLPPHDPGQKKLWFSFEDCRNYCHVCDISHDRCI